MFLRRWIAVWVWLACGLGAALPARAADLRAGDTRSNGPALTGLSVAPVVPDAVDMPLPQLCAAARKGDVEALNQLAWAYAYGKGAARNDAYAAYLFFAASTQGHQGAKRMMHSMSWPAAQIPQCLLEVPPPGPAPTVAVDAPPHIDKMVRSMAPKYGLDPKLVLAVIAVESNFDAFTLSPKNAMGLMQLIPETSKRFGVSKPFDARENIRGGMSYLRWLLAYFEGDLVLVAAAYNAGEGAVEKHRGVPPYAETQDYVRKVIARVGTTSHTFDTSAARPSPALRSMNKIAEAASSLKR
jgi:soluble lytic murein transglycosylase-like protein